MSLSIWAAKKFWLIAVRGATVIQAAGAIKVVGRIAGCLIFTTIGTQHQATISLVGGAGVTLNHAAILLIGRTARRIGVPPEVLIRTSRAVVAIARAHAVLRTGNACKQTEAIAEKTGLDHGETIPKYEMWIMYLFLNAKGCG